MRKNRLQIQARLCQIKRQTQAECVGLSDKFRPDVLNYVTNSTVLDGDELVLPAREHDVKLGEHTF